MDTNRFDHIAKLLARTPSRRGAVAALAGAAVAALLPIGRRGAAACGGGGAPCDAGTPCCDGITCCDGRCVHTNSDSAHCGGCGNACTDSERCHLGLCCPGDRRNEGGVCVCGQNCSPVDCNTDECNGRCLDLKTSERHCGKCGNRCRSDQRCSYDEERGEARCCPKGKVFCGGRCIVCDGLNRACVDGACGCAEWAEKCDGRCVNLDWSEQHCGTCGNACRDGDHCSYRHCCPENHEWCERDGQCVFRICDGQDGHHAYDPENCQCDT